MKKYSKKQIQESIAHWQKILDRLNESENLNVDGFDIQIYEDKDEIIQLIESVIQLVIKTYTPIGGYYGNTNIPRLKRNTSMIKCVYDKKTNSLIACSFYRNVDGSFKLQAYGRVDTQEGKDATKAIIHSDVIQYKKWIWGEVSMGPEKYFKRYDGYPLPNDFVKDVLPNNKEIQISEDGFHYKRNLGIDNKIEEKVIFGFKNKELFEKVTKLAEYEMLRQEFNTDVIMESNDEDLTIKSFNGACQFVNQLSDLYDEKGIRQLTPGIYSMLNQSIDILKNNLDKAKWVQITLDDAEYLRDNISTIECFPNPPMFQ